MSGPLKALEDMKRLTSPFPHSGVAKQWQAEGKKVLGYVGPGVPEEIIHAARMMPCRVTADNEPVSIDEVQGYMLTNVSSFPRAVLQTVLEGKWDFLDGLVVSVTNEGSRRLFDTWDAYRPLRYMDTIFLPLKQTEHAVELYLADLEDLRRSIEVYNRSRKLMQSLYDLRKREHPPITGAETLEVVKAATRMPREQFNERLEQLLDELESSSRGIVKGKRLMVVGSQLENSKWVEAIEALDAIVVTDELEAGTRYFWGQVEPGLPPLEALARYYLLDRPPTARTWPAGPRFDHIFNMAEQYKVDGVIEEIISNDGEYGHDKLFLVKEMADRHIPMLDVDLTYSEGPSGQLTTRVEAFLEMIGTR
jgi:benzoyl-CoA reductase/2-hydroxyglutaryl-CoA dehydratase subunit BcrC/BadD/HgdB